MEHLRARGIDPYPLTNPSENHPLWALGVSRFEFPLSLMACANVTPLAAAGSNWTEAPPPPRPSYPASAPSEHTPVQYPQAASAPPPQDRPRTHDQHVPQPMQQQQQQQPPPQHQQPVPARSYQPAPQPVTPVTHAPSHPVQPSSHHQHHHKMVQHAPPRAAPMAPQANTAPPGPPPGHYPPPQQPMVPSEKEKMLAGQPFLPFNGHLIDERNLCMGAVNQFNSTSSASVAIAHEERGRHFESIVAARWISPRANERHGHLGSKVHVATPFHCDYGYNLSIADRVAIGPNCQFFDSARICIGRNTRIGGRVTISTVKTPTDPKQLKGSEGTEVAREVWIGENCYIGDDCTIEAGVKIGDFAIVRPGSVVVRVSFVFILSLSVTNFL